MKFPCEIIVWTVLPSIKCQMAVYMKEKGISQKEIAKLLSVTEAAVSQYLSGKRANDFDLKKVQKEIQEASDKLIENPETYIYIVCDLCKKIRKKGLLCENCKDAGIPHECSVCKEIENEKLEYRSKIDV